MEERDPRWSWSIGGPLLGRQQTHPCSRYFSVDSLKNRCHQLLLLLLLLLPERRPAAALFAAGGVEERLRDDVALEKEGR